GNNLPSILGKEDRSDKHIDRRAGGAGAKHPHGEAAPLLGKETGDIGGANREGGADEAERQSQYEKLPELVRIAREPHRYSTNHQQQEHDDPTAEPVRPDAKRKAKQRSREHRGGGQ